LLFQHQQLKSFCLYVKFNLIKFRDANFRYVTNRRK